MIATVHRPLMTADDLLAMPLDGVKRELIRGVLREERMTKRNPLHSGVEATLARLLGNWLVRQPKPRGRVLSGEGGFRLRRDPDTAVGIDVAHISPELAAQTPEDARIVDGPPILAVEILSPSDKIKRIMEKVREYLAANVPIVWLVEPYFKTVLVYRPDQLPEMFNLSQELSGEPHLPGLRIPVADIFAD